MYLLDTDHVSLLQPDDSPEKRRLLQRLYSMPADKFFVSIVSFQEQTSGWNAYLNKARKKSDQIRGYAMLKIVLADFNAMQILDFDLAAALQFELLKKQCPHWSFGSSHRFYRSRSRLHRPDTQPPRLSKSHRPES